jgi:nucleoside 2-deoxyribosyltransferase
VNTEISRSVENPSVKPDNLFEVLDKFFLDIIGNVIPGITLIFGTWIILNKPILFGFTSLFTFKDTSSWVFLIVSGYILGYGITSFGELIILPIIETIALPLKKHKFTKWLVVNIISKKQEKINIRNRDDFKIMVNQAKKILELDTVNKKDFGFWRNIALAFSQSNNSLVYRFTYISLFNLGIATVLTLFSILWISLNFFKYLNINSTVMPINHIAIITLFISAYLFLNRYYEFNRRSLQVPFSSAIVNLQEKISKVKLEESNNQKNKFCLDVKSNQFPRLYLAGGFHSGWQDKIKSSVSNFNFIDPRIHNLNNETLYTLWDLEAIRQCDWIFAYLEKTNPGCYALSLEIGFAKALGKRVLLVDEKSSSDEYSMRYLKMVRASSDVTFDSFEEALKFMNSLSNIYK